MGLIDYYRQFDDIDEEEVNRELRARRARERALALAQVPPLDLSGTEWPDLPSSEVMNAAIYTARGRINGYPDRHATTVRRALAERHGVLPEQVVVGNGAAELLQSATYLLLGPDREAVTPWPSHPIFPILASRAGGKPVPVELTDHRADLAAISAAVNERTGLVFLCNPNDPTSTYVRAEEIGGLAARLPEHTWLVVDEAYVDFQDADEPDAVMRLTEAFPRLVVLRTFSKAYGLSGLRGGYAVGAPSASDFLEAIAPAFGVNALTQSALAYALDTGDAEIARRREAVIHQRARLMRELAPRHVVAAPSQTNFLWLHAPGHTGSALAASLEKAGVFVAPGGPLGAEEHVRVAVRSEAATNRFLSALENALNS